MADQSTAADTAVPGTAAKSRNARGSKAGARGSDASPAGFPVFCRPRHYDRRSGVYIVPFWEFTSRWLPEELKHLKQLSTASASNQATALVSPATAQAVSAVTESSLPSDSNPGAKEELELTGRDDDAEDSPSDSEQSEIGWEGPLGSESRVWSRVVVDGALMLMRHMQAYGLGVSAALFESDTRRDGTDASLDRQLAELLRVREPCWAVFALRSGHFAGAVFQGQTPLVHKAIHRYTVRAKSGGAQSAKDNTGKSIKSAGSSLRRYGEQRLAEEIRELMTDKWVSELASSQFIFFSVSKRMKATLLGTEKEPFVAHSKVRRLPFMVGKPKLESIKEAYLRVASVAFAEPHIAETFAAKFRPVETVAPSAQTTAPAAAAKPAAVQPEPASQPKYSEEDDEFFSALHTAAMGGDEEKILALLDEGADPTSRDGKGRVPFYVCSSQRARDAFRRWRGANEDAWDWQAAKVPEGLTDEMEQRRKEKEKEKKKKQKDKQKVTKGKAREEEEAQKKKEEEEARALEAAQAKCDSCKKPITSTPFKRLVYLYCSPECVSAHRRELQAEAAMKRFASGP